MYFLKEKNNFQLVHLGAIVYIWPNPIKYNSTYGISKAIQSVFLLMFANCNILQKIKSSQRQSLYDWGYYLVFYIFRKQK